jgi:hypothetical protein
MFLMMPHLSEALSRRFTIRSVSQLKLLSRKRFDVAQRTVITLIDDLDGTEIAEGKGETVAFAIDGKDYAIDLTDKNASELRKALAPYVDVASRVTGRTRTIGNFKKDTGPTASDVRTWAKDNGHDLPERGRISAAARKAYDTAH